MLQTIKGSGVGLVALIACPCHLPLTLPLLLALSSGTAVGGWLTANQ
jgi:mercuric ion transport protein